MNPAFVSSALSSLLGTLGIFLYLLIVVGEMRARLFVPPIAFVLSISYYTFALVCYMFCVYVVTLRVYQLGVYFYG